MVANLPGELPSCRYGGVSGMDAELAVGLPSAYGVATYPPGATFGPRVLRDFEFVWMIGGDAEYCWGGTVTAAPAGSILLCRPGATDFFRWDRQNRTRHGYFHFPVTAIPDDWPPQGEWPLVRVPPGEDILRPLFRHLLTWREHGDARQCRLTVAHLLSAFVSGEIAAGSVGREVWPDAVERAYGFLYRALEEDPARPLSLAQLADAASVTPEYLCRLFKASVGHSPVETVRLARLDYAAGLLARSNYSVSEISGLCGFANPYHFSRVFKSAYGRTPTEVRRAARDGAQPPSPRLGMSLNRREP